MQLLRLTSLNVTVMSAQYDELQQKIGDCIIRNAHLEITFVIAGP